MGKFLDLAGLTAYDRMLKEWFKDGIVDIADDAISALFVTVAEGPADNEIWYTTVDGSLLTVNYPQWVDANVVSNTYTDKGVLTFDKDLTILDGGYDPFTSYDTGVFGFNEKVKEIILPKKIIKIGENVFNGWTSLDHVILPTNIQIIGSCFNFCPSLKSIDIPNSIKQLSPYAFSDSGIYNNDDYWYDDIFYVANILIDTKYENRNNFYIINVKPGTLRMNQWGLKYLTNVHTLNLPNSIKYIDSHSIEGLYRLSNINYDGTMDDWNNIYKENEWIYQSGQSIGAGGPIKVNCLDGVIELEQWIDDSEE